MPPIPLSWNDPSFSGATSSSSVTLRTGETLSYKSITDTGDTASVVGLGSFGLDHIRISSREGVRIGGDGDVTIRNSYLESTGQGNDHADTIQIYAPGSTGNVTITNTTIVAHNTAATAGMFVADDWSGTLTFDNVVFKGGPFGLRVCADSKDISVSLKNVFFVGPFGYDDMLFQQVNAPIHITQWENVRSATMVNGELVPGALIAPPLSVEGGVALETPPNSSDDGSVVGDGTTHDGDISSPPAAPKIVSLSNDSGKVGDFITSDNTLTLKGTAAPSSTVTLYEKAAKIGSTTSDGTGAWSFATAALTDGVHKLVAKVTDDQGRTGPFSSALSVTVDTHAPGVPTLGVFSANGKSVKGTTTIDDFLLKGSAEANSTIKVLDAGKQIGTATTKAGGTWSFDTGHLADGKHSFTSSAIDTAGNTSALSAAKGVTVLDMPNKTLGITDVQHVSYNSVVIKGTADAYSQIKIYDTSKSIGSVTSDSNGTWSFSTHSSSQAIHTFSARQLDHTGQTVASSGNAITGTSGANTLTGTSGDDVFVGNGHPDTFVFAPNFGNDVINDFKASGRGHDTVQFSKSVFDNLADVLAHAKQAGSDVVIAADHGDSLTLKNTKLGALDKSDFHFV